eukprot:gene28059-34856_t
MASRPQVWPENLSACLGLIVPTPNLLLECFAMLYKFKSRAAADLILLEPQGRQILQIIGKAPAPNGIVTAAQIPAALAALEAA